MAAAKILYIAGAGRSGSTLIEMLLGNLPGYFSIGEARHFFEYLQVGGKLCGCGAFLTDCPFWSAVVDKLQSNPEVDLDRAAYLSLTMNRTRNTWQLQNNALQDREDGQFSELVCYLSYLYEAIWEESGQLIIVDSSKVPSHLFLLNNIKSLDLRVLHLLRDGRAVAYSWSKRRKRQLSPIGSYVELPHRSAYRAIATWMLENLLVSKIGRKMPHYTQLRYEAFTGDPRSYLENSLLIIGLDANLEFLSRKDITLSTNHSVGGNPLRFQNKQQQIVLDEKWRRGLDPVTRTGVTFLAAPILLYYGYHLT